MKKFVRLFFLFFFLPALTVSAQEYQPFYEIGKFKTTIPEMGQKVGALLAGAGYEVIGAYHPENKPNLYVLCYTSNELKQLSLQFPDRGLLGAVLKVGFLRSNDTTTVSILNPEYQFLAYWGQQLNGHEKALEALSEKVTALFGKIGVLRPFGGKVARERLMHYHYKFMMPYFDDPDELAEFSSFEKGLHTIQNNLEAGKGDTHLVYKLVFPDKKTALFGVALQSKETGEADFLPVIGESHLAALPYEIILQGKKATALAGKYRIALFWPELGMGTFMKIIKTPGNIEDTLEKLTSK